MTTWRGRAAQFLFGGAVGAVAKTAGLWTGGLPALDLLGTTSLAFVAAAVLFGWSGLAGVTALHVAWALVRGSTPTYVLLSGVVYAVAGAVVHTAFARVPGIGRGMPNLRSFWVYALASGTGALLTGSVISLTFDGSWQVAALWIRSTVVTVLVFGPPILILGKLILGSRLAEVPGEIAVRRRPSFTLAGAVRNGEIPAVVLHPEPGPWRSILLGSAMILLVCALTLATSRVLAASGFWVGLLYLVPILWACHRHRLPGGLLAAGTSGFAFLVAEALTAGHLSLEVQRVHELACYAYLFMFVAIGAVVGAAREREAELLQHLSDGNRRLRADLQRVTRALSSAVEAKDLYTEGHLQRVSEFAVAVGRRLGLSERELELLQIASALHDVGKIGIPEHVLNKPGALDEAEREIVQRHPQIGARILENVEGLEYAAPLVLHHQERWDGRRDGPFPGYPGGLAGEAIPLGARIIAVVDAFDAMSTSRPYRPAVSTERATTVLRAEGGKQFDPRVVEVFLDLLEERPWG
jgi:HD domain